MENDLMKIKEPMEETEEEKTIKLLVDDIYEYEEKILEINSYLEKIKSQNTEINISSLKKKENEFKDKLNLIKIKTNDEINKKQNMISAKKKILKDIETQINSYISKLSEFNTLSFNSLIMTKYIISNNINEFLTKEQIDNIINSSIKKENFVDQKENDENGKDINKKIEQIKYRINQMKENLLMMKEEKKGISDEIIELISKKETVDSLVKTCLINLYENNNYNNNIIPEIQIYELNFNDTNKISKEICDELYEVFDIKNKEINKNKISNKELSLNISSIKDDNNNTFNKKNLEILIKSELDTFLLNQIKSKEIINNLMNNLCIIISTKLQLLNVEDISSDKLKAYLLYYFKSIYYDNIIENKFKFINKEYKIIKKEMKKLLENLNSELSSLETKKEQIQKNQNINLHNNKDKSVINLTNNEQEYIQICSKGNSLLKQKEDILSVINNLEKEIEKIKIENKEETEKINAELNLIKEEINNLTNNEEKTKIKLQNDIINYRKIISDKFDSIKNQLQSYKNKYGSNLGIYNRLIDGINDTIKLIYKENNNNNSNNAEKLLHEGKKENENDILISKNNYNIINKLISLTKGSECYFREISNIYNKYNPIENTNKNLSENPFYFSKAKLNLNKSYDGISFNSNNLNYYYNIGQIDNTIMSSNLKIIIDIHRDYRKFKNNKNNKNIIMIDFIKKEKMKYLNYSDEFIEKCALNNYFNFSLLINEGRRIEIVLCNYDDFKLWINGFAFIIKNKKQILQMNKSIINK